MHQGVLRHLREHSEDVGLSGRVGVRAGGNCKKQLGLDLSLYKTLQILSVTAFQKTPILAGFFNFNDKFTDTEPCIQLNLFDFQWDSIKREPQIL